MQINEKQSYNDKVEKFDKCEIKGILTKFRENTSGTHIFINGNKKYTFYRIAGDKFLFIAKKGDSIIKKSFADSIILKKPNGDIFKFSFKKPDYE